MRVGVCIDGYNLYYGGRVGLVNPTKGLPAGALNDDPNRGAGGHWWYQPAPVDFTTAQLPVQVGPTLERPPDR